jgi:branched-chain amino acid transport system ATP-binding protein
MTPLLQIDGLEVSYGRISALRGVSLQVNEGEIVAIVGPNGAGKSTLMSSVAGLVRPAAGAILFRGVPILGQALERTVRRGIALVPEGRHVFAGLTVLENLRLGATIRGDRAKVADEIAGFMDLFPILSDRRNAPAGTLSGGEQQMLVIARGLLSNPALLMLDEPSLGLAPRITDQVYDLIESVRNRGVTVLVVEQNADRALRTADRTYVLNSGGVRLAGASADLRGKPEFEAAYFGIGLAERPL